MTTVLLLIHLFVTVTLIGVVLIQRSEGGGLGIGTSQGMGSFMSGRGTANLLTRTTAILGAIFFGLSLALALLNRGTAGAGRSILDVPAATAPAVPGNPAPVAPGTTAPVAPATGTAAPGPAIPNTVAPNTPTLAPVVPANPVVPVAPAVPAAPSVPTN